MTRTKIGLIILAAVLLAGAAALAYRHSAVAPALPSDATAATSSVASPAPSDDRPEPAPLPVYASRGTTTAPVPAMSATVTAAAVAQPAMATLTVDGTRYAIHAAAGSTLEQALQQLKAEGQLDYATETYSGLGSFVTEINGRAGGNGHYWILYVNGKKSGTGISSTRIRSGDLIDWKLEQSY